MTVSDVNTEGACEIAVSQAMKHMRPDSESELLNVEDTFPAQASREVCNEGLLKLCTTIGPPTRDCISSCQQS